MQFVQRAMSLQFVIFGLLVPGLWCNVISYVEEGHAVGNEIIERPHSHSWLKNAQDMMSSPAGHVVMQVAKELLNRSAGNSQVLSLNLTNLLIILLLKILIFAAGMLGAGHWSGYGYGYGRAMERNDIGQTVTNLALQDGENYLITGFLAAQGSGVDDCLYAAACATPAVAYAYAKAAKALLDGIEKFERDPIDKARYVDLIMLLERAAHDGYRGLSCNTSGKCDNLL